MDYVCILFSFIFVGDPQIGSSNSMKGSKADSEEALEKFYNIQSEAVKNDSFNWNYTLSRALEKSSDAECSCQQFANL